MKLSYSIAKAATAAELATLHAAVAAGLTHQYGEGPWTRNMTEKGVLFGIRHTQVVIASKHAGKDQSIAGTFRLCSKKPWAIDTSYFTPVKNAIYLTHMAVLPSLQRKGIGRMLLEEAVRRVRAWPGDAIRLDAFDAKAGAGGFYTKCGFRECGRVSYRGTPLIYFELVL